MKNGLSSLFAAAYLVQGGSLQKMAASGALPRIWHALKKKSGRRGSPATTGVRQQKEELVHSVKDNPRLISLRVGSHSGSAVHSGAPPSRPLVLLFLFWTVHGPFALFLLARKTGAPARPAAWGEEEGTEQSAVLAARRGRSGRSFFRRHGACNKPAIFMAEILPRPLGRVPASPAKGRF